MIDASLGYISLSRENNEKPQHSLEESELLVLGSPTISNFSSFLVDFLSFSYSNLLTVRSHQVEISKVSQVFFQGYNNTTRVQVEPMIM